MPSWSAYGLYSASLSKKKSRWNCSIGTTSNTSNALYDDLINNIAKSRFNRDRNTLAGLGRNTVRSNRAAMPSTISAVRGGAALAKGIFCCDGSNAILDDEDSSDTIDDTTHLLLRDDDDDIIDRLVCTFVRMDDGGSTPPTSIRSSLPMMLRSLCAYRRRGQVNAAAESFKQKKKSKQ